MSRNFRIDFEKAVDDKTPQEELVYTAYRSNSPIQTVADLESATSITQATDVDTFTVEIPDEDQYLNITVKDKAENVALYEQVFVEDTTPVLLAPDSAPTITSTTPTQTEVSVGFTAVDGATSYQYRFGSAPAELITSNPFTVDGLDPNTNYTIQVRGRNSAGNGPWSDPASFTTLQVDAPSTAPSITDFEWNLDSATITRSSVSGATGYEYRLNESIVSDVESTNPFIIEGLAQNTSYIVEVRAYNDGGEGPWSDSITFTTDSQVVDQPVITSVGNTNDPVEIAFEEVDFADSYDYNINGTTFDVPSNPFSISLDEGQEYNLRIRGTNQYGNGDWSETTTFITDYTPPVVGNNGAASVSDVTDSGFNYNFEKATDNVTAQNLLVYKLFSALSAEDLTLENIQNQTLEDEGTDVSQLTVSDKSAGEFITARALVEDQAGNIALYDIVEVQLDNPELALFTVSPQEIEMDQDESRTVNVEIEGIDGASEKVFITSLNTDIATVSVAELTGSGSFTINSVIGDGGFVQVEVETEFKDDFGTQKKVIDVFVDEYEDIEDSESVEQQFETA